MAFHSSHKATPMTLHYLTEPSQAPRSVRLSPLGKLSPREVNGLLQGEELLTNRDELLAPNLRRFLLNCIGFHDKPVLKTEAGIGQNPDSWIPKLFSSLRIQTGPYSQNIHIWGLGVDDCKIKTYSKWE